MNDPGVVVIISNEREKPYSNLKRILRNSDKFITLTEDDTDLRIFGKPVARLHRRMGVMLTSAPLGSDLNQLREKCKRLAALVKVC